MSFFDERSRLIAGGSALGIAVLGAATAGALAAATHPVAASAALNALANAVSCATSAACVSGTNSTSGPGIAGTSAKGAGVQGTSKSVVGVSGVSTSGVGLEGTSTSGTAVQGTSTSGNAVYGYSTSGTGVHASNSSNSLPAAFVSNFGTGYGLFASSSGGTAVYARTTSGPFAISATANTSNGTGVIGFGKSVGLLGYGNSSSVGDGVDGVASGGTGVRGSSVSGNGGYFDSNTGYGAFANTSTGVAFVGRTAIGNASDIQGSHIGLLGRAPTSGFPLVLTDAAPNTLLQVDGYGNLAINGSYQTFAATIGGGKARSFSPKSTLPTIEDTGTAQLVSGVAMVRLDPTFAASIDSTTAYRVFVTPAGDTRGLFVANRTPAGFVVRESQAGRSTVAFDYRVVATALGQTGQRMVRINPATDMSIAKAPLPVLPSATIRQAPKVPSLPPATP